MADKTFFYKFFQTKVLTRYYLKKNKERFQKRLRNNKETLQKKKQT